MRTGPSEKAKAKKGLWSPDEDQKLTHYVINYGHSCWSSVPINAGLQRNGKSCRLRWINYLRPGLKRGPFSPEEDEIILSLHGSLGNKWSLISQHLPGRTDNEIKNYWHSHLKKRVAKLEHLQTHPELDSTSLNSSSSVNQSVSLSHISSSPKILFADWINLDEFQHDFGKLSDEHFSHGSTYQLTPVEDWLSIHQINVNDQNGINNVFKEELVQPQMTLDQIFNFIDGDLSIDDFLCI